MEHLRRETGASVMLSVYEGGSVITLDQVESREGLRIVSDIGSRLPVFCTSQGKVFLAHMSRAVLEREIPAIPVAMWMEVRILSLDEQNEKKSFAAISKPEDI